MTKTHLIIPCTAKKMGVTDPMLVMGSVKTDDLKQTQVKWLHNCTQASKKAEATELYTGVAFKKLTQLGERYSLDIHIMSAGFGLISEKTALPNYNATFTKSDNCVPLPVNEWWNTLVRSNTKSTSIREFILSHIEDRFIICVSNEYLNAIRDDLLDALNRLKSPHLQVVIVSTAIPKCLEGYENTFLTTSRNVFSHPKIATIGLSRIDQHITSLTTCLLVEALNGTNQTFSAIIADLKSEIQNLPTPDKPNRQVQDHEFISKFIEYYLTNSERASKSDALRKYRNEGNACAQNRFYDLYNHQTNKRKDIQ